MKIYLFVWIITLITAIIISFNALKSEGTIYIYMIISWLIVMAINYYEGHRLLSYTKEYYKDDYRKMKSFDGKEGVQNGFSTIAFVFSDDNYNDNMLIALKSNYKKTMLLLVVMILSYIILYILLMFI